MRRLRAAPYREPVPLPGSDDAASFHWRSRATPVAKGFAHDHGRVGKSSLDVAVRATATEEHVARHVLVQEDGAPREGCLQTGDCGKRLVFDLGQLASIGRLR